MDALITATTRIRTMISSPLATSFTLLACKLVIGPIGHKARRLTVSRTPARVSPYPLAIAIPTRPTELKPLPAKMLLPRAATLSILARPMFGCTIKGPTTRTELTLLRLT